MTAAIIFYRDASADDEQCIYLDARAAEPNQEFSVEAFARVVSWCREQWGDADFATTGWDYTIIHSQSLRFDNDMVQLMLVQGEEESAFTIMLRKKYKTAFYKRWVVSDEAVPVMKMLRSLSTKRIR